MLGKAQGGRAALVLFSAIFDTTFCFWLLSMKNDRHVSHLGYRFVLLVITLNSKMAVIVAVVVVVVLGWISRDGMDQSRSKDRSRRWCYHSDIATVQSDWRWSFWSFLPSDPNSERGTALIWLNAKIMIPARFVLRGLRRIGETAQVLCARDV